MAVVYNAAVKSARMQNVVDAIDQYTTPGTLEVGNGVPPTIGTVLVRFTLNKPSFTEANGVITMTGIPKSGPSLASGVASAAQIKAGDGTVVVSGLRVGTSNADVNLTATLISSGQTVTLNSGMITHG